MIYLTVKDVVKINAKLIAKVSPGETIGIKDAAALDMAINQPQQVVFDEELYPSIYDKAVMLAINIAKCHPFCNANECTAFVSMITFFISNGYQTSFSRKEAVDFILNITTSTKNFDDLKLEVSDYLRYSDRITMKHK